MRRVPWLHITGRGIGIWLMLVGFLHSPKTFISVMLGGFLLYIFGDEPDDDDKRSHGE